MILLVLSSKRRSLMKGMAMVVKNSTVEARQNVLTHPRCFSNLGKINTLINRQGILKAEENM